jgi:peptidoglycan/xylan/chitin deacetylase (PgdA/CDA1 family)
MLKALARKGMHLVDDLALAMAPGTQADGDALVSVLFHSLCRDRGQLRDPALVPNQTACVEEFRAFVGAMLENGYTAVSPEAVDAGLARGSKYLMITFDDGYFNNTLALDVLQEFQVPATFFISAHHVLQNKAFWWDAFHRELAGDGASADAYVTAIRKLKALAPEQIENRLETRFGPSALRPRGDQDRPFTPRELKDFARSRWVHIGNHTCDHAILTHCSAQEVERQIGGCQQALRDMVGYAPISIAYPNGNFSPDIVEASLAAGLRVGTTTLPHRNKLPLAQRGRMTLGRFPFTSGQDPREQCRRFSAGFVPSHIMKTFIHSPRRAVREREAMHHHA